MEEMETNIGECIAKRMKENSSLTQDEARKRCSASVVVEPSGGSNPQVVGTTITMAEDCPPATLDIPLNIENRQKCIDQANYGPLDPNLPNDDYWKKKFQDFFKKNKIRNFEQLNIWNNIILKKIFFESENRYPNLNIFSKLNIVLFYVLENYRLLKKIIINNTKLKSSNY
jgi:hypothetical protein